MKQINIVTCPICGDDNLRGLAVCRDHYATGEQFTVCRCTHCGFVFTQGAPDESVIGRYYDVPAYISHSDTSRGVMNKAYHRVRSLMLRRKGALAERVSGLTNGRLIDIGAGTGYFANEMQRRGWTVTAVEKAENARHFAADRFGLQCLEPAALSELPAGQADVVSMWHVMEHVQHLHEEWRSIARLLAPEGRLIVAVPNHESADRRHYGPEWAAYDVPRHLWHFTADSMTRLAAQEGFELVEMHPMPFDAYYISMLSERYRGHRHTAFLRGLVVGTLCLLQAWANPRRSSSLTYVFRKKSAQPQPPTP